MTMRVLVVGGSGMLGHKLVHVLSGDPAFDVHCTVRRGPPSGFVAPRATYHEGIDVFEGVDELRRTLRALEPEIVVNAVGAVKQRDLSSKLEETFFVNGTLPHLIPLLAEREATRVLHFSTDCVFQGDRGGYMETDVPDAEDVYGRSKACGEIDYGRHLTLRTSIIGFEVTRGLSLVSWLFTRPPRSEIAGYTKAIFSGLPTVTLARSVQSLLTSGMFPSGLYHVASEPIDKHSLLQRLIEAFHLDVSLAPREDVIIDRSLNDVRFRGLTGETTPGWDELVRELVEDFDSLPYNNVYQMHNAR